MPRDDSSLVRFVHSADLHLDSPFVGMKSHAPRHVAEMLYEATFTAYDRIVDLCIEEQVDALLIAGDVYDGADRSLRAQRRFIQGLERLDGSGIRSFVCHGNHDPLDGWEAGLRYPPSCHRFGSSFEAAPMFEEEPDLVKVHGISYPTRDVFDNLVHRLGRIDDEGYAIGLLHANVDNNLEHRAYAPCSMDDLVQSGVDYWALGHVHTRRVISIEHPTAVYPGNPQGRHPNETGARGVYLVEVDRGRNVGLKFEAMDVVRWENLEVDISGLGSEQELIDRISNGLEHTLEGSDGRSLVVRVSLSGRGPIHETLRQPNFVDDLLSEINAEWAAPSQFIWCERIEDNTASPFDRDKRLGGSDFVADLLRLRDQAKSDTQLFERLSAGLSDLYGHRNYRRYLQDSTPDRDELEEIVDEAEKIAVGLLIDDGNS